VASSERVYYPKGVLMRSSLWIAPLLALSLATPVFAQAQAPAEPKEGAAPMPQRRDGNLKVGDPAPDFTVTDVEGKKTVRLLELKGKPVVLIFGSCT
jgi:cytochrome oxidase Cu insertion factor (SCO1/SenC/PrrC family)